MQKGIYERTNKGLGFKLTDSTSFGESLISIGFIQKTIKGTYSSKEIKELFCGIFLGRF
jgi:hypothetical protein